MRLYQEPMMWYYKTLAINATDLEVLNNKAIALALAGHKEQAVKLSDKALSIDPTTQNMLQVKGLLQK